MIAGSELGKIKPSFFCARLYRIVRSDIGQARPLFVENGLAVEFAVAIDKGIAEIAEFHHPHAVSGEGVFLRRLQRESKKAPVFRKHVAIHPVHNFKRIVCKVAHHKWTSRFFIFQ